MHLTIPDFSLVLLVGASGSGKSTFARRHFKPTEVLSSDYCRGLVADDENDQSATGDAFEVLHYIAAKRLAARRLTVVDATNVRPEDRQKLVQLARQYHALAAAIVFNLPAHVCAERNRSRPDRDFGGHVIRNQIASLRRSLNGLKREGFSHCWILSTPEEIEGVVIERTPLWTDRRDLRGPFDIIGDVHGCFDELSRLLRDLGYRLDDTDGRFQVTPPDGRMLAFVGDLVDRGPRIVDVLRLVMDAVESGAALCVMGNHEMKLLRKLQGRDVKVSHGLAQTLEQLAAQPPELAERAKRFIDRLLSHYVLDDWRLVIAHAGLREEMQGRGSNAVRAFALYGETTGETDEYGFPVRYNWAADYRGKAHVVYGHTPVPEAEWLNRTICLDTGCVFGGKLTALRYPEMQMVSVPAARVYFEPSRPLGTPVTRALSAQHEADDLLDLADVTGKRILHTRYQHNVTIRAENAAAALEVMSRFAIDPKWLIYLPPTMSPTETSRESEILEHPTEAFAHFSERGVHRVVCQEKHMGSRAIVVLCRGVDAARTRFGVKNGGIGVIYTRTGRPFFPPEGNLEGEVLARLSIALASSGMWDTLQTDWICLDCELMPWSAKAKGLLLEQYAPVGAAASQALAAATHQLVAAGGRGVDVGALLSKTEERAACIRAYTNAYRRYCWEVKDVGDLKLAPFHVMASEGAVHADKDHAWHMATIAALCAADPDLLRPTHHVIVDLADEVSRRAATEWWIDITTAGSEGMVVKPIDFIARDAHGLVQPALKVRGRDYLRIIYGPEYTLPQQLDRLRARGLSAKRGLALREFALGLEGLERFVAREPLRRVHECVFGVLALESEPVDPRL
jgi:protein phosphatase